MLTKPSVFYCLPIVSCNLVSIKLLLLLLLIFTGPLNDLQIDVKYTPAGIIEPRLIIATNQNVNRTVSKLNTLPPQLQLYTTYCNQINLFFPKKLPYTNDRRVRRMVNSHWNNHRVRRMVGVTYWCTSATCTWSETSVIRRKGYNHVYSQLWV